MMHSGGGIMRLQSAVRRRRLTRRIGPGGGRHRLRAAARAGPAEQHHRFDMGGTTAKAALVENGEPARTTEYEVGAGINLSSKLVKGGGYPIKLPFIDVSEIGAGGGSIIVGRQHRHVSVGPQSAGVLSGPGLLRLRRSQGRRSPTPLALGYINDAALGGRLVHASTPKPARAALRTRWSRRRSARRSTTAARGVLTLAVTTMTRAVKAVSTYRGRDPRDSTLVAFGGNGPVVGRRGRARARIRRVLVPPRGRRLQRARPAASDVEQEFVRTVLLCGHEISTEASWTGLRRARGRQARAAPRAGTIITDAVSTSGSPTCAIRARPTS